MTERELPVFAKRLRELRDSKELSQKEFGKPLTLATSTISMYERGEREPDHDTLRVIADYYHVSTEWLLGRSTDQNCTPKTFIPKNLAILRGSRTYQEYAEYIKIKGDGFVIEHESLRYWEKGIAIPDEEILKGIAEVEEITPDYFYFTGDVFPLEKFRVVMTQPADREEYCFSKNVDLKEWMKSKDALPYLEFIFSAYQAGFTKELLEHAEISFKPSRKQ